MNAHGGFGIPLVKSIAYFTEVHVHTMIKTVVNADQTGMVR